MDNAQPDERERRFLLKMRVARLATVDERGEAYVVPVCYAWDGSRFVTPIDEKPKRDSRPIKRVRNIEATGRASLVIDHYDDSDWSQLAWVMVRGRAEIIPPGEPAHAPAIALLRQRYRQYHDMALEQLPVIALIPERITSWGKLESDDLSSPNM